MSDQLILASSSTFRRKLLEDAGLSFEVDRPDIDERVVEAAIGDSGVSPKDVALILAEAKAQEVSSRHPEAFVIGSDQTLSLEGEMFHKPATMDDARRHLLKLSGKTHSLNSAVALARGGETVWSHVSVANLTMRPLDAGFVGRYMSAVGEKVLQSVGGYQIEGAGIQLFDRIDGDHFTIVGLPLLPLLKELRRLGAIDG